VHEDLRMLTALAESAFIYAYPLYATASTRYRAVGDSSRPGWHAVNTLRHERALSDHTTRWITSPNNDTLYSNAWLDLSAGPVRIRVERMPEERYWSVALLNAWTDHFGMLGQRLQGTGPVEVTVVAPGMDPGPEPGLVIQAPGLDAWLFARCLVDGPEDLPIAHAMQERIQLHWPSGHSPAGHAGAPGASTDPERFLAIVNEALGRNPPPAAEALTLAPWARVGLRAGDVQAWSRLDKAARAAWTEVIAGAHERLRAKASSGRRNVQGWFMSAPEMGQFGSNHALRASVALGGLGALEPSEALYFVRVHDDQQATLDGRNRYVLQVPAQGIPTVSFWSFTMYEPTADGQRFFVDNAIRRYSVGNRTPGLQAEPNGALHIALQHEAPQDPRARANWLPAPQGPFQIALRTYLPQASLRRGDAQMPSIVRV
jgi:hypothetical protein